MERPLQSAAVAEADPTRYDVLIIGGGPAGLAAAAVLGRAHRRTALIDAGQQSNRTAEEVHAVFTRDCCAPDDLYAEAAEQLRRYSAVEQVDGSVSTVTQLAGEEGPGFEALLENGRRLVARYLLLAQGVNYAFPPIPGIAELWGREVWHCPYCHGFEATGKRLLAVGDAAWLKGMSALLPVWTPHITWAATVSVTSLLRAPQGVVACVDGADYEFDQVIVQTTVIARDTLADSLGCQRNEKGQLVIGEAGGTSVDGVFAAGDQTTEGGQVNIAAAAGHKAGVALNEALGIQARPDDAPQAADLQSTD